MADRPIGRTRPTRVGVATLVFAALMGAAGRVTGLHEFVVVAVLLAAVNAAAWLVATLAGRQLDFDRTIATRRVEVGDTVRCVVTFGARRPALGLPVELVDTVAGEAGHPRAVLPTAGARIVLPTPATRRGALRFGRLEVRVSDPLGFMRHTAAITSEIVVLVVPRVVPLATGPDAATGVSSRLPRTTLERSDEFASLRTWLPGDDVRHVDWAATARVGFPTVREFEPLRQGTTTVLLHRGEGATSEAFERAVVAAASVIAARVAAGDAVRLLADGRVLAERVVHPGDIGAVLDRLALVDGSTGPVPEPSSLRAAGFVGEGTNLVVCCGTLDPALVALCSGGATTSAVTVVDASATADREPTPWTLVPFVEGRSLSDAWNTATTAGAAGTAGTAGRSGR